MYRLNYLVLVVCFILSACQSKKQPRVEWRVPNLVEHAVKDKAVEIKRSFMKGVESAPYLEVQDTAGKGYPYQLIDTDGDGRWDVLFTLIDLPEAKEVTLIITGKETEKPSQKVSSRANVRFGSKQKPYREIRQAYRVTAGDTVPASARFLMEGPAWESDKIAFRNYFDQRNGIDIFGKRSAGMVLDSVGIEGSDYHTLADWGMDILHVGASLGAGAVALLHGDSLFRINGGERSSYRLIADGPLKAMLELRHPTDVFAGKKYSIVQRLSTWGGFPGYQSEVTLEGLEKGDSLVSGLVNLHNDSLYREAYGDWMLLYTHDRQAEDGKMLGMMLAVPRAQLGQVGQTANEGAGITHSYLVSFKTEEQKPVKYYFLAGWETQDPGYKDRGYFVRKMKAAIDQIPD